MRKQHVLRSSKDGESSRFGFTTAANLMNGSPNNTSSEGTTSNKCSSTWRAFFQRLNQEENMPLPFNDSSDIVVPPREIINQQRQSAQTSHSSSLIFNRLMSDDVAKEVGFSKLFDETSKTSESNSVLQQQPESIEEGLYSVFTKRGMKSCVPSTEKSPIIYSPPKFSASTSCAIPVSRSSVDNGQLITHGTRPYVLSSTIPTKRRQATTATDLSPAKICSTGTPQLPGHLADRPIMMFLVLYSVSSTRKHKKWENDGFLYFDFAENQLCLLKALDKQPIARHPTPRIDSQQVEDEYVAGHQLFIGGYEVQIQEEFFTNLRSVVKEEKYDVDEEDVNGIKRARVEDDKHFFDEQMENYLVKTENDENEPVAFGLFNDNESSENHPHPVEPDCEPMRAVVGVKEEIRDEEEETRKVDQMNKNYESEIGLPAKEIKMEHDQ